MGPNSRRGNYLLLVVAKAARCALVVGPARFYFHPELEHDLAVDHALDLYPRRLPDQLDATALLPDQNALLTLALHQDGRADKGDAGLFLVFLDFHRRFVGQLVAELAGDFFANDFRRQKA